jgi:O-antigen/teichoic acid export membrane protein
LVNVRGAIFALMPRSVAERIEKSPLGYRLARGSFWSLLGTLTNRAFSMAASVVAARALGREQFGEWANIHYTVALFAVVAGFGLAATASKHVAEFRSTDPARAARVIALIQTMAVAGGILGSGLMAALAPWLSRQLAAPHLDGILRIGALLVCLGALNGAQSGILSGLEAFKAQAAMQVAGGVASFIFIAAGVYWRGLEGAMWGVVASGLVQIVVTLVSVRLAAKAAGIPAERAGLRTEFSLLWSYSFPALLAASLVVPVNWACAAMLAHRPGGYSELGVFNAASQWRLAVLTLPSVLGQVLIPMLSERLGAADTASVRKLLRFAMLVNFLMGLSLLVVGGLLSRHVMELYGPAFSSGATVLVVVLVTAALISVQTPVGQLITASGRMWLGFAMNCGWAVAVLVLSYLWLDHGALGLALAQLVAYVLLSVWTFGFAWSFLRRAEGSPS